jgi:hypothetical protein
MSFHENSDSDGNFPLNLTIIDGFTLPKGCEEMKKQYDNLEFSEEDVWICSFPRSGCSLLVVFYLIFMLSIKAQHGRRKWSG